MKGGTTSRVTGTDLGPALKKILKMTNSMINRVRKDCEFLVARKYDAKERLCVLGRIYIVSIASATLYLWRGRRKAALEEKIIDR